MPLPPQPSAVEPTQSVTTSGAAPGDAGSSLFNLISLDVVDSTNTVAKKLCAADALDRTLVWARRQTAGRGRHSRSWVSPPGNLYVSLILRPRVDMARATALTFVAAVAVGEAISAMLPPGAAVTCKWPNDVLVRGRKVAGILLESSATARGELDWVIVGIGVNVASHPDDGETIYPATSLAREGGEAASVDGLLEVLCRRLDHWCTRWTLEGFSVVREAWLARGHGLGQPIAVSLDGRRLSGIFSGLDGDGALIVECDGGTRRITAGDVFPAATTAR